MVLQWMQVKLDLSPVACAVNATAQPELDETGACASNDSSRVDRWSIFLGQCDQRNHLYFWNYNPTPI